MLAEELQYLPPEISRQRPGDENQICGRQDEQRLREEEESWSMLPNQQISQPGRQKEHSHTVTSCWYSS